jgi:hypothetical protein
MELITPAKIGVHGIHWTQIGQDDGFGMRMTILQILRIIFGMTK